MFNSKKQSTTDEACDVAAALLMAETISGSRNARSIAYAYGITDFAINDNKAEILKAANDVNTVLIAALDTTLFHTDADGASTASHKELLALVVGVTLLLAHLSSVLIEADKRELAKHAQQN